MSLYTWRNTLIHIIDFEGTPDCVLEYGVVSFLNGVIQQVYTQECKPPYAPNPYVLRQIGSLDPDNESKKLFSENWSLFSDLRRSGVFCAHHACVEDSFLSASWPFTSQCMDFKNKTMVNTWGPWLDTHGLARNFFPSLSNYKLEGIVRHFGLMSILEECVNKYTPRHRNKWHNALYDALGCAVVLDYIINTQRLQDMDIKYLINWSMLRKEEQVDYSQFDFDF